MNVKVVIIVVFVVVLALLGAPLVLGAMNGNMGGATAKANANAEWNDANLPGTTWGAVHVEQIPEFVGAGTVTVDVAITFQSGGTFSIKPDVQLSPDVPAGIQAMTKNMVASLTGGSWSLNYPQLTLKMVDPKGEEQSVVATISGSTISGPNLIKPGAEPLILTRRF
jgi:hypothetical protein